VFAGKLAKKCPKCAEEVKMDALVCKHCSFDFSTIKPSSEDTNIIG
jgi:hypothetical protein